MPLAERYRTAADITAGLLLATVTLDFEITILSTDFISFCRKKKSLGGKGNISFILLQEAHETIAEDVTVVDYCKERLLSTVIFMFLHLGVIFQKLSVIGNKEVGISELWIGSFSS